MTKGKLIELWKNNCMDCEAAKPIVEELEREGFAFDKHSIEDDPEGGKLWGEYAEEIDKNNQRLGYETGYIYTPTFINPKTREVIAFADRAPTKEEILKLAGKGDRYD